MYFLAKQNSAYMRLCAISSKQMGYRPWAELGAGNEPSPSLLPSLCPSSLLLPCSPAGGCFAWGRDCRPPPLPQACHVCILAGWCKHACGEELTYLPLPSFFRCPGWRRMPGIYHIFPSSFLVQSLAGPLAEPAPCR